MSIKRSGGRVVMPSHMIGAAVMGLRASVDWAEKMVVDTRFELVTPAMSKRSFGVCLRLRTIAEI